MVAKKIWMRADKIEIPRPRNFGFWNITSYLFRGDFVLIFQLFFLFSHIIYLQPLLAASPTSLPPHRHLTSPQDSLLLHIPSKSRSPRVIN